jgi:hypothetical protein
MVEARGEQRLMVAGIDSSATGWRAQSAAPRGPSAPPSIRDWTISSTKKGLPPVRQDRRRRSAVDR